MSVIGRLDDQVEAVLINPIKRERKDVEKERDAPPAHDDAPPPEERDAEMPDETREADAALPVW